MRGIKDRLTAAAVVIVGLALIRTNADPTLWQIGMISIGLYESVLLFVRTAREVPRERSRRQIEERNYQINKRNGRNLKEYRVGQYWPMEEVSS